MRCLAGSMWTIAGEHLELVAVRIRRRGSPRSRRCGLEKSIVGRDHITDALRRSCSDVPQHDNLQNLRQFREQHIGSSGRVFQLLRRGGRGCGDRPRTAPCGTRASSPARCRAARFDPTCRTSPGRNPLRPGRLRRRALNSVSDGFLAFFSDDTIRIVEGIAASSSNARILLSQAPLQLPGVKHCPSASNPCTTPRSAIGAQRHRPLRDTPPRPECSRGRSTRSSSRTRSASRRLPRRTCSPSAAAS